MGQPVETVILKDIDLEDRLVALLPTDEPFTFIVEPANDYPGQQLAVIVYAAAPYLLEHGVKLLREILTEQLGVDEFVTASELDAALAG